MSSYKTPPLKASPVAREKQPTPAPALAPLEGSPTMRHKVNLTLGKQAQREQLIKLQTISLRERIARFLLGDKQKYTLVVPGDSIEQVTIIQKQDDDLMAIANAVASHPASRKSPQEAA